MKLLSNHIETIKSEVKELLGRGIDQALNYLSQLVLERSPLYNTILQIKARYSAYLETVMLGTASQSELNITYAQLISGLLILVDKLHEKDILSFQKDNQIVSHSQGELLYYVPAKMQTQQEYRCLVRLAYTKSLLYAGWDAQDEDVLKSIRVAQVMAVEVFSVAKDSPFLIHTFNHAIQFLEEDVATDWIFLVKPTRPGEFSLALRISVVEIIQGREVKKDMVFEQQIIVITEKIPMEIPRMQASALGFSFIKGGKKEQNKNDSVNLAPKFRVTSIHILSICLIFLTIGSSITWAITPPYTRDWYVTYLFNDSADAYQQYLKKYPKSPYREKAIYRRALKSNLIEDYRAYQQEYANSNNTEFKKSMENAIDQLEFKAYQQIITQPDTANINSYLKNYPEGKYNERVQKEIERVFNKDSHQKENLNLLMPSSEKTKTPNVNLKKQKIIDKLIGKWVIAFPVHNPEDAKDIYYIEKNIFQFEQNGNGIYYRYKNGILDHNDYEKFFWELIIYKNSYSIKFTYSKRMDVDITQLFWKDDNHLHLSELGVVTRIR